VDNLLIGLISLPTFFVIGLLINLILTLCGIHAEGTNAAIAKLILQIIYSTILCSWMIVMETVLLSQWGTTPGKYLLGLCVKTPDNHILDWPQALRRSSFINAALFGIAWIPLLGVCFNLGFMLYQRRKLMKFGYTSWDQPNKTLVAPMEIEGD
jgi:hypothetical protein